MVYLKLKQVVYKEIFMKVDFQENTQIEIECSFSFNVNYSDDNTACIAKLRHELVCKEDPNQFRIAVEAHGLFSCEGIDVEDNKKQAHVQSYSLLFPYLQEKIAGLSKDAGCSPIMIEMANMRTEDVIIQK